MNSEEATSRAVLPSYNHSGGCNQRIIIIITRKILITKEHNIKDDMVCFLRLLWTLELRSFEDR